LPFALTTLDQCADQTDLVSAGACSGVYGRHSPALELEIDPRYEEEVARPGLQYRRAWEEQVGESTADGTNPELVDGVTLTEELDHFLHPAALSLVVVEPG
jgi:hypothetical protein